MDPLDILFYTLVYSDALNSMALYEAELREQEPN